jgi:dTDP-4-dehydrorhamnose 3,5-epimerase
LIDGVVARQLKLVADERGWLMEVLRRDWDVFEGFGQAYITAAYTQVVKAWHMHRLQTDNIACVKGMIKLVVFDARRDSNTKGEINEFIIGEKNPMLLKIPPGIWHGFKTISQEIAVVMNVPTNLYDYQKPDEHRLPANTEKIPYDWKLAPWLKHG